MTRTHHISLLAVALLASFAPGAVATEATGTLDVVDAQLDPMPPAAAAYADVVAARLEVVDGETLRATIELAALPEPQPGVAYVLVFQADGVSRYAALAMVPLHNYVYGVWGGVGPDTMEETTGSYTSGPGGTIHIDHPISPLGDAMRLHAPLVYVVDVKGDATPLPLPEPARYLVLDEAQGDGEIVLREPATGDADPAGAAEEDVAAAAIQGPEGGEAVPTVAAPEPNAVPPPSVLLVIGALALVAAARR